MSLYTKQMMCSLFSASALVGVGFYTANFGTGGGHLYYYLAGIGLVQLFVGLYFAKKVTSEFRKVFQLVSDVNKDLVSCGASLDKGSKTLLGSQRSQGDHLASTASSLNEISEMAKANIKDAEVVDFTLKEACQISSSSQKTMDDLSHAMRSILESNERIEKLVNVIEDIGAKTKVIDEIVFKTQLLSFNASVEAERAGEHGRGFSVVAQEVGNLAQMSGKAALEISTIVKNSIRESTQIASENRERVSIGGQIADQTKTDIGRALKILNSIQTNTSKIVQASREQGFGINQITKSVENINVSGQAAYRISEETSKLSEQINQIAGRFSSIGGTLTSFTFVENSKKGLTKPIRAASKMPKVDAKVSSIKSSNVVELPKKKLNSTQLESAEKVLPEVKKAVGDDSDPWEKI